MGRRDTSRSCWPPHHHRRRQRVPTRRTRQLHPRESPSRRGNHALKKALFLSAFASLKDPASRAYYDRKRVAGKRHNAAMICLARRRVDVLHAMLRVTAGPTRPNHRKPPIKLPESVDKDIETPPPDELRTAIVDYRRDINLGASRLARPR